MTTMFVLLFFSSMVRAQLIELTDYQNKYCIGKMIQYIEDQSNKLTFTDVSSSDFNLHHADIPNFGFSDSDYWLKWDVVYTGKTSKEWLLETGYPHLDYIELYIIDKEGNVDIRKAGDRLSFHHREMAYKNYIFHITFKPNESKRFYLKIRSESSIQIPLFFWEKTFFSEYISVIEIFYGLFAGGMLILFFYNIFLFIAIRDKMILYLLAAISTYTLSQLTINGHAFQYLWQDSPLLANKTLPIWIIVSSTSFVLFSKRYIEVFKSSLLWKNVLLYTFISGVLIIPLTLIIQYKYNIKIVMLYSFFSSLIVIISAIVAFYQKYPASRFFFFSWLSYFLGALLFILKTAGIVPANFITEYSYQIGSVLFIMLMSSAIVDRIHYQRNQNEQVLKDAIISSRQLLNVQKEIHDSQVRTGCQIDNESKKIFSASDHLTQNFSKVNLQAEDVSKISEQMTENIKNIAISIDHMGNSIDHTLSMAKELSSSIRVVFQSIDQMSESMQDIEKSSLKGLGISHDALKLSQKTTLSMSDLDQAAVDIGKVSEFIKRISDKTNLLSLNAAIESASAGESGKGFAIVANSIQKFADQSAMAADEITLIISDIQLRTQEAGNVIAEISGIVENIHSSSQKSSNTIEDQGKTIVDIVQRSDTSEEKANSISQSIHDLASNADDILQNITNIARDFDHVSSSIKDVSQAIVRSLKGVIQIKNISTGLSETSKELQI